MKPIIFADHPRSRASLAVPGKSHVTLLTHWLNDQEVRQYLLRFAPVLLEGEGEHLTSLAQGSANRSAITNAMFLIVDKQTSQPVGTIGLHQIDWRNRHATTGTLIGEKTLWGKGLGTDAKMLLLNWAFNELGLNSIESHVIAYNARSAAYSKKCGYQEVGRLRQRHFRHGQWHDDLIFEVLAEEWRPLWAKFEQGEFRKQEQLAAGQTSHGIAWHLNGRK